MKNQRKQEQEEKNQETIEMLESHPLTKKIREEQEAKRLSSRKAAHQALLDVQGRRDKELPPLVEAKEKAASRLEKAKQKVLQVEQSFLSAKSELARVDHALKVEHGKHIGLLTETFDPALGEAIQSDAEKVPQREQARSRDQAKRNFGIPTVENVPPSAKAKSRDQAPSGFGSSF